MGKMIRNWAIVLVLLVVLTLLWHNLIFGGQYVVNLEDIVATNAAGEQAPRMLYFILAHVVAAVVFVYHLPAVVRGGRGQFALHGALAGLATFGFFALLSHGLFQYWTPWLMWMDISFGIIAGAITGWVMSFLAPRVKS